MSLAKEHSSHRVNVKFCLCYGLLINSTYVYKPLRLEMYMKSELWISFKLSTEVSTIYFGEQHQVEFK